MGLLSKFKSIFVEKENAEKYAGVLNAKEGKIIALEKEIAELKAKEGQIVLLQKELASLREATSRGDATIQAKEARIATLERTITTLKEKMESVPPQPEAKPKPELKPQPRKSEPASTETPSGVFDDLKAKSSPRADDPYQQLGQELVDAFRKTTKQGENQPRQDQ